MEQQAFRWAPLTVALVAALLILLRNVQMSTERRSPGQWLIFRLYRIMQFVWALVRGIDVGYLEYRRVLQQARIEVFIRVEVGGLRHPSRGVQEAFVPKLLLPARR